MPRHLKILLILQTIFVGFVASGLIGRSFVPYFTGLLAVVFLIAPLEEAVLYCIATIPLCIAIPITPTFDNFNMWRIFSVIIFARFLIQPQVFVTLMQKIGQALSKPLDFMKQHQLFVLSSLLLLLAAISLIHTPDLHTGLKRIIYFINLSLAGIVAFYYGRREASYQYKLIEAVSLPVIIVTIAGFIQLISTYFIDIYTFMRFWGERVQLNLFGAQWADIAVWHGNTWFAYFGEQLSLRMFSIFPDSHSFPIFILMGLPAIMALAFDNRSGRFARVIYRIFIVLILLAAILSGTRGIWLAGATTIIWVIIVSFFMRYQDVVLNSRRLFHRISFIMLIFLALFGVAYPIMASQQFRAPKDSDVIFRRIRSIIDLGETSNSARLQIWRASLHSIAQRPFKGVGIGNFPVVLNQKIIASKAGSSAHNLYLHIAAEMGLPALIISLVLIALMFWRIYQNFLDTQDRTFQVYSGTALVTIPWVFMYLTTDPVIFDERAFLMFAATIALIWSIYHTLRHDTASRHN